MKPTTPRTRLALAAAAAGLLLATPSALRSDEGPARAAEAAKLVETLRSGDATLFQKAKACQRLAVIGGHEAVPALAALLGDEKLGHYARFGLEPNPDPSVDAALREALGRLKGKLLVGVIDTIGMRRDAGSLERLVPLFGDPDGLVASAALAAVGRIGTPPAAKALAAALPGAPAQLQPAAADACLVCGEQLISRGDRSGAAAIYDALRAAPLAPHLRAAGLRGAILARGADGLPLLLEALRGDDRTGFAVALGLARTLPGTEPTAALLGLAGKLPAPAAALVLAAVGDRRDPSAVPGLIEAARSGEEAPRAAAVRALGKLGDRAAVPAILEAARSGGEAARAAAEAVESFEGKEIDEAIVGALDAADPAARPSLIALAGRRHLEAAVPALRKLAGDADEQVRLAALAALGETVGPDDLPLLTARAASTSGDSAAAFEALRAACKRLPEKDRCAGKVIEALSASSSGGKGRLLAALASVGGEKALGAVVTCAREGPGEERSAALQVLAGWPSEDAAPALLEMAKGSGDTKARREALEAFGNVVAHVRFPKEKRLALCEEAMAACRDDDERKVVIHTLAAIPAVETFPLLLPHLAEAGLKEDAAAAAVVIGERIARYQAAAVAEAMRKVIEAGVSQDLTDRARKIAGRTGSKG